MRVLFNTLAIGLFALLAACNTMQGLGEDVQSGGQAIEETAEDTQSGL